MALDTRTNLTLPAAQSSRVFRLKLSLRAMPVHVGRLAAAGILAAFGIATNGLFNHDASAIGDSRALSLYYTHTKDTLNITYKRNGYYDRDALKQLNYFLRDWRHDEPIDMDPKLFDVLWEVYREAGHEGETINVVSAYRSPETNAMLRRRSRAVAKFSQHMLGKAMDTTMPGVAMSQIREIGMRLQRGGVGYYPTAGTPFVHLDVGGVRAWPRMTTSQLVSLFPDQKTVHLPSDGPPLAGYQEALADIQRNGGSAGGGEEEESGGLSLLAAIFGGGKPSQPSPGARSVQVAARGDTRQQTFYPNNSGGDDTGVRAFLATDGLAPKVDPLQQRSRTTRVKVENPIAVSGAEPIVNQPVSQTARPAPIVEVPEEAVATREPAIPMPPLRPSELLLASLPLNNAPLPPTRPPELAMAPPAQALQLASAPAQERSSVPLPPILDRPRLPAQALGYATTANVGAFLPLPPLRGTAQPQTPPVGLVPVNRPDQKTASTTQATGSNGQLPTSALTRRAPALQMAALVKDGIVATRFERTPRLEAGRFTQGMTRPLGASFVKASLE